MSIWSQMFNALKGKDDDFLVNQKAIRILDDELRTESMNLKDSKDNLAELIANKRLLDEKISSKKRDISSKETEARSALEKNNETKAVEIAEEIVELESEKCALEEQLNAYDTAIKDLQNTIQHAELNIKRLKLQVETIKATESIQRAQAAVSERHGKHRPGAKSAQEALELLKQRQATKAGELEARSDLNENTRKEDIKSALKDAGIATGSSEANAVLSRLKNTKKG